MAHIKHNFSFLNLGILISLGTGLRIGEICALLGHANISTTLDLYVHPDLEQKKKVVEAVNKMLRRP